MKIIQYCSILFIRVLSSGSAAVQLGAMPEQPWDGFYSPPGTVDILAEAANDPYKKAAVELFQEIDTDVSAP